MQNSGQTCSAWTRMLVPRARHDEAVELARGQLARLTLGDPFDAKTRLGPLASAGQRDTVLGYIEKGKQEGATLVAGGGRPDRVRQGLLRGADDFRQRRQLDDHCTRGDFRSGALDHSVRQPRQKQCAWPTTRSTGYAGGVWAGTPERALNVARQLRTGQVDINGGRFNALAPFGGYKTVWCRARNRPARARRVLPAEVDSAIGRQKAEGTRQKAEHQAC